MIRFQTIPWTKQRFIASCLNRNGATSEIDPRWMNVVLGTFTDMPFNLDKINTLHTPYAQLKHFRVKQGEIEGTSSNSPPLRGCGQMPHPGRERLVKFPPPRAREAVKCPGYARGGGMCEFQIDRYITMRNQILKTEYWIATYGSLTFKDSAKRPLILTWTRSKKPPKRKQS